MKKTIADCKVGDRIRIEKDELSRIGYEVTKDVIATVISQPEVGYTIIGWEKLDDGNPTGFPGSVSMVPEPFKHYANCIYVRGNNTCSIVSDEQRKEKASFSFLFGCFIAGAIISELAAAKNQSTLPSQKVKIDAR